MLRTNILYRYCISCEPSCRSIQSAEQKFFKNINTIASAIPIIAIFTKFGLLYRFHLGAVGEDPELEHLSRKQCQTIAINQAVTDYDANFRGQLVQTLGVYHRFGIERLSAENTVIWEGLVYVFTRF